MNPSPVYLYDYVVNHIGTQGINSPVIMQFLVKRE